MQSTEELSQRRGVLYFGVLSLITFLGGGGLTSLGLGPWYDALEKPPFQPPGWVFTPVWAVVFALLALATARIARGPGASRALLGIYHVQLFLNAGWSLFFFALRSPAMALVNIAILDAVVLLLLFRYGRIDRRAGAYLVPYAAWLGLATAINVWIVLHNS